MISRTTAHVILGVAAIAAALPLFGSRIFHSVGYFPIDENLGPLLPQNKQTLRGIFRGKRVIVVGGTKGIGRGTAIHLASLGASVTIVGRTASAANSTLRLMRQQSTAGDPSRFHFVAGDLSTAAGVDKLLRQLTTLVSAAQQPYSYLVMTVGAWPSLQTTSTATADGLDRVIAIDVVSRFRLCDSMARSHLLAPHARVLSVLASTKQDMPAPDRATVLHFVRGESLFRSILDFPKLMGSVAIAHDAALLAASRRHANLLFMGSHPGLVVTDVMSPMLPLWPLQKIAKVLLWTVGENIFTAGSTQVQILASPILERATSVQRVGFFNSLLEPRLTFPMAYGRELQEAVWSRVVAD